MGFADSVNTRFQPGSIYRGASDECWWGTSMSVVNVATLLLKQEHRFISASICYP